MSRHAPRGPVKAKPHPIDAAHPMKDAPARCTATNRRGTQCGKAPIPGGTVCRMHGGAAPQVKAKALERLMALQPKAIRTLDALLGRDEFPTVQLGAARDVLDRTEGKARESVSVAHSGGLLIKHEMLD